jgi:hypothetical protein
MEVYEQPEENTKVEVYWTGETPPINGTYLGTVQYVHLVLHYYTV